MAIKTKSDLSEHFYEKPCKEGRGGWLRKELIKFCKILIRGNQELKQEFKQLIKTNSNKRMLCDFISNKLLGSPVLPNFQELNIQNSPVLPTFENLNVRSNSPVLPTFENLNIQNSPVLQNF